MTSRATEVEAQVSSPSSSALTRGWRRRAYGGSLAAISVLILASRGFRAVTGDHHQYLLPVLRSNDPSFTAGDWFTGQTTPFHYAFQQLLDIATRLDATIAVLFAFHLATLGCLGLAVSILTRRLGATAWSVPLVLFVLTFGLQRTWGDVSLIGGAALPHFAGLSLALLTIALTLSHRYTLAAILLVTTSYVHVSVGVWMVLVVAAMVSVEVARGDVEGRQLLRPALGTAVALAPLAIVVAGDFLGPRADPDVYLILFHLRSPHHYSFVDFGAARHIAAAATIAITLVADTLGRQNSRVLRTAVFAITAIGLLGAFFLHVVYWPLPVRLFPYRLAPLTTALAAVLAVVLVARPDARARDRSVGIVAIVVLLGLEQPGLAGQLQHVLSANPPLAYLAATASLAAVGLTFAIQRRPRRPPMSGTTPIWLLPLLTVLTLALMAGQPPPLALAWSPPGRAEAGRAIHDIVPPGHTILVPPHAEDIRLVSGRGIVVDFKAFPIVGAEMQEWKDRMEAVSGLALTLDGPGGVALRQAAAESFHARPLEGLFATGRDYGATYLLVHQESPAGMTVMEAAAAVFWPIDDHVLVPIPVGES